MKFTTIDDYLDKVAERYSAIPKESLKKVIEYGLRSYYHINNMGGDVLLKSRYFTAYSGKFFPPEKIYNFYIYRRLKMAVKYRMLYSRKGKKYDGYYYIGINNDLYQTYKKSNVLANVYDYKLLEELVLTFPNSKIFRIKMDEKKSFKIFMDRVENAEFIGEVVDNKYIPVNYEKRNK